MDHANPELEGRTESIYDRVPRAYAGDSVEERLHRIIYSPDQATLNFTKDRATDTTQTPEFPHQRDLSVAFLFALQDRSGLVRPEVDLYA